MKNHPRALTGLFQSPYTTSENCHLSEVPPQSSYQTNTTLPLIPPPGIPQELATYAQKAQGYLDDHLAPSTLQVYERDWQGFQRWCLTFRLASLPAEVSTVALYITWMAERGRTLSTIKQHLAAIKAKHVEHGYQTPTQSPVVKGVIRGIGRKHGRPPQGAEALLPETLTKLLAIIDVSKLIGKRDRALLLLGFAGAFRRSELVDLNFNDMEWHDEGVIVLLRHSKTDQQGHGRIVGIPRGKRPETCPVLAIETWLQAAKIEEGAIFRGMDCHDRIVSERLSGRAVPMIIQRHAKVAGLDTAHYSGHSLRAGHCTAAARAGVSEKVIMRQTGHRSHQTLLKYLRIGSIFRENSATTICE
ncbi:MAG TPA: site-specific integrase [Armatimonadota bacterium]|jgi:site-specific recombinase XerD